MDAALFTVFSLQVVGVAGGWLKLCHLTGFPFPLATGVLYHVFKDIFVLWLGHDDLSTTALLNQYQKGFGATEPHGGDDVWLIEHENSPKIT